MVMYPLSNTHTKATFSNSILRLLFLLKPVEQQKYRPSQNCIKSNQNQIELYIFLLLFGFQSL